MLAKTQRNSPGALTVASKNWSGRRESNPRMKLGKLPFENFARAPRPSARHCSGREFCASQRPARCRLPNRPTNRPEIVEARSSAERSRAPTIAGSTATLLLAPHDWQVDHSSKANSAWHLAVDDSLHEIGREKSKRQLHGRRAGAAPLAGGKRFNVRRTLSPSPTRSACWYLQHRPALKIRGSCQAVIVALRGGAEQYELGVAQPYESERLDFGLLCWLDIVRPFAVGEEPDRPAPHCDKPRIGTIEGARV